MFTTIINDCSDDNVMSRQQTRAAALFNAPTAIIRVDNDIEASGCIIDTLDAAEEAEGVILVNVAPRSGKSKKWPNGTPFGYFRYKNVLICSTLDGSTLSLVKKLQLTDSVEEFDIPTVLDFIIEKKLLDQHFKAHISESQFRSFEFLPRCAKWLVDGLDLPTIPRPISEFPDIDDVIWWIDNFGNAKTSLLPDDINHKDGATIDTLYGPIKCHMQLRNVPDLEPGLVIGSSGIDSRRFIELVVQGASAASKFHITTGDGVIKQSSSKVLRVKL